METLSVPQGRGLVFLVRIRDSHDDPITTYTGTEELTLEVWAGDDRTALALTNSTVEWGGTDTDGTVYTADDGVVTVTIASADTAPAEDEDDPDPPAPGSYTLACSLEDGGETYEFYRASLGITARPGTAAAAPVYCTLNDLTKIAAWVATLQDFAEDQAGFAEQRGEARAWCDGAIQRHHRGSSAGAGIGALLGSIGGRTGRASTWLQAQLDAGRLVLTTPDGRKIVRACAYHALSLILRPQIGSRGETPYQVLAARFAVMAEDELASAVAEIDTNDDGAGDIAIDLGVIDVLRG
jgi:hypothetical protein